MEGLEHQKITAEQVKALEEMGLLVLDSVYPVSDDQYRLRPCPCGCEQVAYLKVRTWDFDPWIVRCMGCGKRTDGFGGRHDAQLSWNMKLAAKPKLGFLQEKDWYEKMLRQGYVSEAKIDIQEEIP